MMTGSTRVLGTGSLGGPTDSPERSFACGLRASTKRQQAADLTDEMCCPGDAHQWDKNRFALLWPARGPQQLVVGALESPEVAALKTEGFGH